MRVSNTDSNRKFHCRVIRVYGGQTVLGTKHYK